MGRSKTIGAAAVCLALAAGIGAVCPAGAWVPAAPVPTAMAAGAGAQTDAQAGAQAGANAEASGEASTGADARREVKVADGLEGDDLAAVEQGLTVKIIDQYFDNFASAVEVANQNGGGTVYLLADTVATDDPAKVATIGFRTSISVKSMGDEPLTVYRAEGQTGPMLKMTDGTVSLKNVTFDGAGEGVGSPAIEISDQAVVKFGKGTTVTGNASDGSGEGSLPAAAVSVSGKDASLTLKEGCTISGNTATGSAETALYNDGATVENEGATFEGNTSEKGANPDYAGTGKLSGEKIG